MDLIVEEDAQANTIDEPPKDIPQESMPEENFAADGMAYQPDLAQLSPYDKINFKNLARKDLEFRKIWQNTSGHLDFQDSRTIKTITKAHLNADFGIEIDLPDDRLCPPVPNRFNYVAWIQGLIDSTNPDYTDGYDPNREVVGLDIGTGASAIYTLLLLRMRSNWTMCATDVDKKSFDSAAHNLALNNMLTRTKMLQTIDTNDLIPIKYLGVEKLDFTICNPPFFENEKDMHNSLKGEGKSSKPNAVCTGSEGEMICAGGDLGFVTRLVHESLALRDKVTWYSSMLGKMNSAKAIINLLKKHGVSNWAVGCLEPGGVTKRWIVAWSFGDLRPKNDIARIETIAHEFLPFPTQYKIQLNEQLVMANVFERINKQLSSLDLSWVWDPATSSGLGLAPQNVWNRKYRRQQKAKEAVAGKSSKNLAIHDEDDTKLVALAFRISVFEHPTKVLRIDWLRGSDNVLWESFCGFIHQGFKKNKDQEYQ
ncbi:hypothetical protein CC78DRAFT_535753 [Lojkania enalia]|uniref:U6 small nuclear RNA (adenine-(43)-N(6))-methyltransferase n=1 Tax=Lojkania enalia TaxID=147567 RepID=A0A9P4K4D0_9PLEO|nr:hypothetical protein CC78DRAFT_535753 [Didymosphaeria enalia]